MSDLETSVPTREDMAAELSDLRAERAIGEQLLDAARARSDQDTAAVRDITADRDRWQHAAENMRTELWRQVDEMRHESSQQREQITQLSTSLAALLEAIVGTAPAAAAEEIASAGATVAEVAPDDVVAEIGEVSAQVVSIAPMSPAMASEPIAVPALAEVPPAPVEPPVTMPIPAVVADSAPAPASASSVVPFGPFAVPSSPVRLDVPPPAAEVAPELVVDVVPEPVSDAPAAHAAPDPAPAPSPAPPLAIAPYVPANEPKHAHLQPKPEPEEFVPAPDGDRVGVLTELMAVAIDSEPETVSGATTSRAVRDESAAATVTTVLPTEAPVPAKRRRLPRLSG